MDIRWTGGHLNPGICPLLIGDTSKRSRRTHPLTCKFIKSKKKGASRIRERENGGQGGQENVHLVSTSPSDVHLVSTRSQSQKVSRDVKTYRRHRCTRKHRTYRTLASCMWPRALWVHGEGPWASVAHCGRGTTVQLCSTVDDAQTAKSFIDNMGCGGRCGRNHEVIYIDKETA